MERQGEERYEVRDGEDEESLYGHLSEELRLRKEELARCIRVEQAETLRSASTGISAAHLTTLGTARHQKAQSLLDTAKNCMARIIPPPPRIPSQWSNPQACLLFDVRRSQRKNHPLRTVEGWACGDPPGSWRTLTWEAAACSPEFQYPKTKGTSVSEFFDTVSGLQRAPYLPLPSRRESAIVSPQDVAPEAKDPLLPSLGELFLEVNSHSPFLEDPDMVLALVRHLLMPALRSSAVRPDLVQDLEDLSLERAPE